MLTEISYQDSQALDHVAEMHMELLEFGPMAGLGMRFVREVCYRGLLKTRFFRVVIYSVNGEPAGFMAFTNKSKRFHEVGLKESRWLVVRETLLALLRNPLRFRSLLSSLRVLETRRHEPDKDAASDGEVICLAVRPQYLGGRFVRESGKRLSEELVVHAAKELQKEGVQNMRMIVDDDNKAVLFLYHRLGASFETFQLGERPSVIASFSIPELIAKFDAPACRGQTS